MKIDLSLGENSLMGGGEFITRAELNTILQDYLKLGGGYDVDLSSIFGGILPDLSKNLHTGTFDVGSSNIKITMLRDGWLKFYVYFTDIAFKPWVTVNGIRVLETTEEQKSGIVIFPAKKGDIAIAGGQCEVWFYNCMYNKQEDLNTLIQPEWILPSEHDY